MRRKFWVLSWSDSRRGFGVEWYCLDHRWIRLWAVWFFVNVFSTFKKGAVDSWIFNLDFWLMNSVRWENYFVFNNIKNSKINILCWRLCPCMDFEFGNALLEFSRFAGSRMGSDMLLCFRDLFWRSGLLEYWIRSYVRGHCFGSSLRPDMCPSVALLWLFSRAWHVPKCDIALALLSGLGRR